jgi:hypothetical protein
MLKREFRRNDRMKPSSIHFWKDVCRCDWSLRQIAHISQERLYLTISKDETFISFASNRSFVQ